MKQQIKVKVIEISNYKFLHILSNPPRIQAKIIMDRDDISQKLLYTLMEICDQHGFSCSPPSFPSPESSDMVFLVGTTMFSNWLVKIYAKKLQKCIDDILSFISNFKKQIDFTTLDVSMFNGVDLLSLNLPQLAAVRDQNYDGSWIQLRNALISNGQGYEVSIVDKCIIFEKENAKDIGFVGHKLGTTLRSLEKYMKVEDVN